MGNIPSLMALLFIISSCGLPLETKNETQRAHSKAETQEACTEEYTPVCGQPPMPKCPEGMACIQVMPPLKTYSNRCMLEQDNAQYVKNGSCQP